MICWTSEANYGIVGGMRIDVLGVGFDNITAGEAVSRAREIINSGEKAYVVTPNPEIVWMAKSNEQLRGAIDGAGLVLADGIGIIIGARILGTPLAAKIPGIDFASALFTEMAKSGGSVYLLGAATGIAEDAGRNLARSHPGLVIAGTSDGYFEDDEPVIEKINAARPDVLLVCLGAPKQELWMAENVKRLDVRLLAGLGGSLDVFAGAVRRAPVFWRKLQLEWFYRLLCEPRRIKRMIKLPMFLLATVSARVKSLAARK